MRWVVVLALFATSCAVVDATFGLPCVEFENGCACDEDYSDSAEDISCSLESRPPGNVCCETTDGCECSLPICVLSDSDYCICHPTLFTFGGRIVDECAPAAGEVCCRGADIGYPYCQCGSSCVAGEEQVASCTPADVTSCGVFGSVNACD